MAASAADPTNASTSRPNKKIPAIEYISSDDDEEDDESEDEEEEEEEEDEGSEGEGDTESEEESDDENSVSDDEGGSSDSDDDNDGGSDDDDDAYDDDEDDDGDDDVDYDDNDDDSKGKPTDEDHCSKVIGLLHGRKSLNVLKSEDCKAYLRKHKLRISGSKEICIKRIQEHCRIKDGNGKKLYPKSSFVINCTGDVCKGDVVLFEQRVYEKFDIVKRGGGAKIIGRRVLAGRVVNESYGSAKQQHTFSIDVLWSEGVKALPPLFPLLVKGRNLYRLKTFRQRWSNEAERSKVLAEKHNRGATARHVRAIAKAITTNKGIKRKRNSSVPKAPTNKKRKPDLEHARGKHKKNYAKNSSNGHANPRKVAKASNVGPFTTRSQTKTRKPATRRKPGPSSTQVHIKPSKMTNTRNLKQSVALPEQPRYHPNGNPREHPCPPSYAYYHNYNHPSVEAQRMHYLPSHNTSYPSQHGYNSGYPSFVHGYEPNRLGYHTDPYRNLGFEVDARRQFAIDDRLSGTRYHGWRKP